MEELIKRIRELHQLDIYTVNEQWCIQLFHLDVCANDEEDCIHENSGTVLWNVLSDALEWAQDRQRQVS